MSMSHSGWRWLRSMPVASVHLPLIARRSRSIAASCCRRIATDGWARARAELTDLAQALDELAAPGLPTAGRRRCPRCSSFIGRDRELAELKALLGGSRMLTLARTGWVGKTRLALELARAVEASYPAGAALVELAPLTDRAARAGRRCGGARCAGMPGQGWSTRSPSCSGRVRFCSFSTTVSICSQRRPGSPTRFWSASQLTVLATSREPLHVPDEVVFRVLSAGDP